MNILNKKFFCRCLLLMPDNFKRVLLWLALLELIFLLHWANPYSSDEGLVLTTAWEIMNGKKLYTSLFSFVAPGSFYFLAGIFKIFGAEYFIAKFFSIMAIFFSACGIYKITNFIFNKRLPYLTSFIFVFLTASWPAISYYTFNLLFIVWGAYFFIAFLDNHKNSYLLACGFMTCLAVLTHQIKGAVLLLAVSSFLFFLLAKEKNIYWLKAIFYYSLVSLAPLALLFLIWPPKLLADNLFIFPFLNYSQVAGTPYYLLTFFLLFLFFCAWLLRDGKKTIWFLLYFQLAALLSAMSLANSYHINLNIFPLIAILPLVAHKITGQNKFLKITFAILSVAAVYMAFRLPAISMYNAMIKSKSYDIAPLKNYLEKNCFDGKYAYFGPFMPGLYFEFKKPSPTPYVWLITNHHTPEQFSEAKEYLEKNRPDCAVLNYHMVKKYKYDPDNPVDNYIMDNYKQTFSDKNISVYKKTALYSNDQ